LEKFYGCGSPIPPAIEGKVVLDLGSGSGRDSFILSRLVGPRGKVTGIDMTREQIDVAQKHIPFHMDRFGFSKPNIEFIHGYIEDLRLVGIPDQSVDVVVSNCVINLSPRKDLVFEEIFRVLKPGGELLFSDVFSTRRIPEELTKNDVFVGECLGGALYTEDFRRMLNRLGCRDFRVTTRNKITIEDPEMLALAGMIEFYSMTIRAFNLDLEDRCEDYGQTATYLGTISEAPNVFVLDDHHAFEKGRGMAICRNTAAMLSDSRFGKHFDVSGSTAIHFGLFDCGPADLAASKGSDAPGACC
jgi:SAM-dependent methyltransferase